MAPRGQPSPPPAFVRLAAHPVRWQLLSALALSDLRVRELMTLLDEPQNLVSYHLRQLRDGGLVTATRSSHDGRDSYYHLDLDRCADALAETADALHPALGRTLDPALDPKLGSQAAAPRLRAARRRSRHSAVLFVCAGNSIRSPIAEALVRHHAGDRVSVTSAGTRPGAHLHPNTVRVLGEQFGIDVSGQQPRHLDGLSARRFDHVVTLCDRAREACPPFAHHPRRAHWSVQVPPSADGPDEASYGDFQRIARDIETRVRHLLPTLTTDN